MLDIRIFSLPYFLAAKFTAFKNRGWHDWRTSTDFEDIVYLLSNCRNLDGQIAEAPLEVRRFLAAEARQLFAETYLEENLLAHIPRVFAAELGKRCLHTLRRMVELGDDPITPQ